MLRLALAMLVAGALAVPSTAGATTFCVESPAGCSGTDLTGLEAESQGLTGAHRSDGDPDLVWFAVGVFADTATWQPAGSDGLVVRGSGRDTVLTSSRPAPDTDIFVFDDAVTGNLTIEDLTIRVPTGFQDGEGAALQASGALLDSVTLESRNPGAAAAPSFGNATFREGLVTSAAAGSFAIGFRSGGGEPGSAVIEGSTVRAARTIVASDPGVPFLATRSILQATGGGAAVEASGGVADIENTLVLSRGDSPLRALSLAGGDGAQIAADHVTLVNGDGGGYAALGAQVTGGTGDATVVLENAIARGFARAFDRSAPDDPALGNANVTIRYSNLLIGPVVSTGDGQVDTETGNIDLDPLFGGPLDYHLLKGSPSIDAGNPDPGPPAEADFEGFDRVTDGNGDGTVRRDMGAFEFPTVPAGPSVGGFGFTFAPGDPTQFEAPSAEPPGPGLTPAIPSAVATFSRDIGITLRGRRVDRRGRVLVRVLNRNTFPITGTVAVRRRRVRARRSQTSQATPRRPSFSAVRSATVRVRVRLKRGAYLALLRRRPRGLPARLVARVQAPSGEVRRVRRNVRLKLTGRAARRG